MPSDDFNRADGGLGADWTALVGTWTIDANQAECNDNDGGTGYYARYDGSGADVGSSDMWSEGVTNSSQTGGISNAGVAVRHRTGATTGYQFTTHTNDSCALWRVSGGSESQITTFNTAIAAGDTIRLEAVGRTFRCKVNGALRALVQDTNITDGQRGALNGYNEDSSGDVVRFDSWAAGLMTALLAPYLVDWSAQVTGTTTTLTPTAPVTPQTGDLVVAHCTSRDAAQTMTAPGSQGWSASLQTPSQSGLEDAVFAKIWGSGATDDTTPTFSIGAGTAGWGVTLSIYRNPAHATAPWTTVASAIVASGSQANASSATVTAPSVTHDGTHRTVVRLGSSADDNALGTPSAGVLAYGGAAYDQTTGNDYSQASWLVEDVTVTTSTGTSTVTETVLGNDVNNGITLVLAIPVTAIDLAVADADHGQTTDAVALTQVHVLAAADSAQGQTTDAVAVTQTHQLAVDDAAHGHAADEVAVSVVVDLAVADASHTHAGDEIVVSQTHVLAVADAAHDQASYSPALTQAHALAVDGSDHAQIADETALTQAHGVLVADSSHTSATGSPALTQAHSLPVDDAGHSHAADEPAPTQLHELAPDDATQAHTADTVSLTQDHQLTAGDAGHAATADNVTVGQAHELAAADAHHGHAANEVTVEQLGPSDLVVADAGHGQTAESVTLTQQHALTVDDSTHGQTADQPPIAQVHVLAVQDAGHNHAADSPALVQVHGLLVADALHAQAADSLAPAQVHHLAPADAAHGHTADGVTVTLDATALAVHDSRHDHLAELAALTQAHDLAVDGASHTQAADTPTVVIGLVPHHEPLTLAAVAEPLGLTATGGQTTLTAIDDDYPLDGAADTRSLVAVAGPLTLDAQE